MGSIIAVIPARYASTRLPGKPLLEIAGKPMIQHVFERVRSARRIDRVVIATDDERIRAFVEGLGGEALMTSSELASGSDRAAAAVRDLPDVEFVVNIQGDEPLIEPSLIDTLIEALEATDADAATAVTRIFSSNELFDTNVVKVVLRKDYSPLYFSRSPIPCIRDQSPDTWMEHHTFYRHLGIYAYRPGALERFVSASPAPLERCEQLEQLRMLDLGMSLICVETEYAGHSVDTPEDVMRVESLLARSGAAR
jgi:3-deoxy-manno-octulosonate cytidylyltransferase (CMP-KDO synthetase)